MTVSRAKLASVGGAKPPSVGVAKPLSVGVAKAASECASCPVGVAQASIVSACFSKGSLRF